MSSNKKFGALRNLLRLIGLSQESADQVVDFIVDLLAGEGKSESASNDLPEFPYELRNNFLSPAELSFYGVLRNVVGSCAAISSKVNLGDIFWVKLDDKSKFRIYTNKIDRKHVDFLLCDPATIRPLVGIELDDSSHRRSDRQARDAFVDGVFEAADLPLLHIPVRRAYVALEIEAQIAPFLGTHTVSTPVRVHDPEPPVQITNAVNESPHCPKCGSEMILRTAKSGANAGNKFWGCSKYPNCRGVLESEV
jgi:predicted RNA-binding Zn-ribbon protein involved in translation (DUF1610 family)